VARFGVEPKGWMAYAGPATTEQDRTGYSLWNTENCGERIVNAPK
jgi:hypothetical protein